MENLSLTNNQTQEINSGIDEDLDSLISDGIKEITDCLQDDTATTQEKIKTIADNKEVLKDTALFGFEQTVESFLKSHTENLNRFLSRTDSLNAEEEINKVNSIIAINGINELKQNKIIEEHLKSLNLNDNDSLLNPHSIKVKLEKLLRICRRLKIKSDNVLEISTLINSIKVPEFKNKIVFYTHLFLDSLLLIKDKDELYSKRYYVVFQIGLIRLSIQSLTTFMNLERMYAAFNSSDISKDLQFIDFSKKELAINTTA
jgi:hypothetical protein